MHYVRNNIDHSFYTKRDQHGDLLAMLSITVDNLLLSYKNDNVEQAFHTHLSRAFDITTPTDTTKLKFLSLTIYQSPDGTSIDQTQRKKQKILNIWFANGR